MNSLNSVHLFASNNDFSLQCLDVFSLSADCNLRMNLLIMLTRHRWTRSISHETAVPRQCLIQGWYSCDISLKARQIWQKGKSQIPAIPIINTTATRAIMKLQPLMELALSLRNIISPPPPFTGNTGPNGPCITGISIPCLGFTLPSSSVAETLSPTPRLLHQPGWMVRVMTVVCLWVAQTQEGQSSTPLGRIALQLWAPPFTTVTFAFRPQWALYPQAWDREWLPIDCSRQKSCKCPRKKVTGIVPLDYIPVVPSALVIMQDRYTQNEPLLFCPTSTLPTETQYWWNT